jgi:hypothetical protein
MNTSDGSTASYYELPADAKELQQLISHRDMNAQIGEIFRACYRYGIVSHSPKLRDAKKIRFYIEAEIERLEALALDTMPESFGQQNLIDWPETDDRTDVIGQNGNDGEHYAEVEWLERWKYAPEWANYLAMDADGDWFWYESEPAAATYAWDCGAVCMVLRHDFPPAAGWAKTLEARP